MRVISPAYMPLCSDREVVKGESYSVARNIEWAAFELRALMVSPASMAFRVRLALQDRIILPGSGGGDVALTVVARRWRGVGWIPLHYKCYRAERLELLGVNTSDTPRILEVVAVGRAYCQ